MFKHVYAVSRSVLVVPFALALSGCSANGTTRYGGQAASRHHYKNKKVGNIVRCTYLGSRTVHNAKNGQKGWATYQAVQTGKHCKRLVRK